MTASFTPDALRAAAPNFTGTLRLPGLDGPVDVYRDAWGIPHIRAQTVHDAFFAQGVVHAQDRGWQMDYDRHRAYGRLAELVGGGAVPQDRLLRRLRLEASARADYEAANAETRSMLEAYAAGVNAFLQRSERLPVEYRWLDLTPEPWRPWDACAIFKVRHVSTGGVWQAKLWRARLLRHLGPELTAALYGSEPPAQPLIIPPDADYDGGTSSGLDELCAGAAALALIPELEEGSNNWVVAGRRTASGAPLLACDPHRALEVPNVYYQNHLACPAFDAVGLSFPGVPGLPLFGHNRAVAWGVTTAMADFQDLYLERFHADDPQLYEFRGHWRRAERWREVIRVRHGQPVEVDVTVTHHGPIVLGDPAAGYGVALRYTAIAEPNATFNAFLPMLRAGSADEFEEAMRPWVDPGNNLLFADVHGHIGYRLRGQVPIRSQANAWLPVPGWTGEHEWQGVIPFEAMPRLRDPAAGFIVTANNRVVDETYPHYLALHYEPGFRAQRIRERLRSLSQAAVEDMVALQADRVSIPARAFVAMAAGATPADAASAAAQAYWREWDGVMGPDSVAATLYAVCREEVVRAVVEPLLGPLARQALGGGPYGVLMPLSQLRARLLTMMLADDRRLLPTGTDWPALLSHALARTVTWLGERLGDEMAQWHWGRLHRTAIQHPLAAAFPEVAGLCNPPSVALGGDGDTVQAASLTPAYTVGSTAVARLVFDLSDWRRSAWIVPLGASGHPGSPHYADQTGLWSAGQLAPLLYDWHEIGAAAATRQRFVPAP
jgi:penicillin amidase